MPTAQNQQVLKRIGEEVPNFTGDSQLGEIHYHQLIDSQWSVLITAPESQHPVFVTELGALAKLKSEFDARQCKVVALCIDTMDGIDQTIADVVETQETKVNFPIIADHTGEISRLFGAIAKFSPEGQAHRYRLPISTITVADIERNIKLQLQYPSHIGRNFYEVLRALDALQLSMFHQVATSANWKNTEDVFVQPHIGTEEAQELFPKGFHEIKPYFRITPQPDIND